MNRTIVLAIALMAAIAAGPMRAHAQTPDYPQMTTDEELRLAMSAGPLSLSQHADVYVMGARGFERAIPGTNGWACLVVRVAANKQNLAPHCLNPDAVKSVLPAFLAEATLQARGLDAKAIDAELARRFESKELPLPSGPAYAYMMSEGQKLGASNGKFMPHFMLYIPYVTNADIGGDPSQMQFPFVGPFENHPLATVVILMPQFVSPKDVVLPRR